MNKSKLISILKKLDKKEQKVFLDFLDSPFFNRREELKHLGQYLTENLETHPKKLNKSKVWENLYPGRPFHDQQLRLQMSELFKLLEQYLSVNTFLSYQSLVQQQLLRTYRQKNMKKYFEQTIVKARRTLEGQSLRDYTYLRAAYDVEQEHYAYLGAESRMDDAPVRRLNRLIDQQFAYQKLKHSCIFLARNAILEEGNKPAVLEEIITLLRKEPEQMEYTGLRVYYELYHLLQGPATVLQYDAVLLVLRERAHFFTTAELGDIFRLLINFCIRQMNAGQTEYIARTFELYRDGIEQVYLLTEGRLSNFTYINTMFSGLKLRAFDWVEQFLEKYRPALEPLQSANIYYFCLAHLRYEEDRLKEAMKLLVRFDAGHDFFLYLSAQTTLIKIYFQLKEYEPLESLLGSISVYLNRKHKIGYRKKAYKKMVSVCRKMIYLRPGDKERAEQIRIDAAQIPIPSFRDWLLAQLKE
jgi:hypothetical protein